MFDGDLPRWYPPPAALDARKRPADGGAGTLSAMEMLRSLPSKLRKSDPFRRLVDIVHAVPARRPRARLLAAVERLVAFYVQQQKP